jgi:hypothetical protein
MPAKWAPRGEITGSDSDFSGYFAGRPWKSKPRASTDRHLNRRKRRKQRGEGVATPPASIWFFDSSAKAEKSRA